jgi:non-specific serine/threonine protein kinase/serine/threonine-protein kinase
MVVAQSSESTLSPERLESIALQALEAPAAVMSGADRGRVENSLQAALGKHPNIVATWDTGTTESRRLGSDTNDGSGQRIDDYCDSQRLDIPARIRLFSHVCQAVHFAHRHAVIHHDLKPSNIFVTPEGVPKVIYCASARTAQMVTAHANDSTGNTEIAPKAPTQPSESWLKPEYVSPEQLQGEALTTASDIYSLGVVLYQLLTGRGPYRLKSGTTDEVFQAIFEQVPERPSSAVARRAAGPVGSRTAHKRASAETAPPASPSESDPLSTITQPSFNLEDIALARSCSPQQLKRILTGDLDAIVLTALRTEPERRYASAEQLADDLNHYLRDTPVRARGNSMTYRCCKYARRHPALVGIGLTLIAALVIVMTTISSGLMLVRRQQQQAETSLGAARRIIDQTVARISNERLFNQPGFSALRASLLQDARSFYTDFLNQTSPDAALHPEVIEARGQLAKIANLIGTPSEAVSQYRQAAILWEKLFLQQPTNRQYQEELAATLGGLAVALMPATEGLDEARRALRRTVRLIEPLIATEPESASKRQALAQIYLNLAQIQSRQNRPDEALDSIDRLLEIALPLAAEDPRSLEPRITLATAYATAGRILGTQTGEVHKALTFYHQAVEVHEAISQEHPELADQTYQFARDLGELSKLQQDSGQFDMAFQNLRRALSIFERLNESHQGLLIYERGLGSIYNLMSDLQRRRAETADSLATAQKARKLFERLVAEHPRDPDLRIDLARSYNNLGRQLKQVGDSALALRSFQRAMDLYESLPELDAEAAYELARTVARCIPLLSAKPQSATGEHLKFEPSKSDRFRSQLYGDRAIAALRHAVRKGRLNAENLENDIDLDPLRGRSDFQDLIKELEKKTADQSG